MPEKIGKYRVIERIGRGGMGMIYKAHDPVLDRLVALKVISTEVEVTDELRARFFREAQACAKLNHPNIVTVFDMGEDDGRLFIVMELLEGQELRRFIRPDTPLTLEDKLSVMVQACGGLHYAHQKGIVHRDIKPGNIFLLTTGQVKILDFGIAHMASTEGLTRTGLIMGTLRYISPEQVRGRSDHRSDMFSMGSVFYELLTLRPPFTGDDPMHLLEQLRTDEPPPASELDASIPAALTTVVQRAMRKNPVERFRDLEEMRGELEQVQRTLNEERIRAGARVRGQRERLAELQGALAERLGPTAEDDRIPLVDDQKSVSAIQQLERELAARIEAGEAKLARADRVTPAVQRAHELLQAKRFEEAVAQFEAIVADMPEHRLGREGLDRARAEVEAHGRRRQAEELRDKARTALKERQYALCLEIAKQAAGLSLPDDVAQELASLRQTALAEQEALGRGRKEAEEASKQLTAARGGAHAEDAEQYARVLWNEAEALAAGAHVELRREAYAQAKEGFARAVVAYQRAADSARQGQTEERQTAERAREGATQEQQRARAAEAAQYTREQWDAAEARFAGAQAAFVNKTAGRGRALFTEAAGLYRRAAEAAQGVREREHGRAEAARERAAEGRRGATAMEAERRAPSPWNEAVAKSTEAEAAWVRREYGRAADAFEAALRLYHHAQTHVREVARQQRDERTRKQREVAEGRRRALAVEAARNAAAEWAEAEASVGAAEAASERDSWEEAGPILDKAVALYRLAEERAGDVLRARLAAEQAVEAGGFERRAAAEAGAARSAPDAWKAAEMAEVRAVSAFSQQQYTAARTLFEDAGRLYAAARQAADLAAAAEARRVEALVGEARRLLDGADLAACLERVNAVLTLRPGYPPAEALRSEVEKRLRQIEAAAAAKSLETPGDLVSAADALDQTVLRYERAAPPEIERATTALDETSVVPSEPTVLIEKPVFGADRDEATVLARPAPFVEPTVQPRDRTGIVDAPRPDSRRDDRDDSRGDAHDDGPKVSTARKRLKLRPVLIGVGGLALLGLVALYSLSPSPPRPEEKAGPSAPAPPEVERRVPEKAAADKAAAEKAVAAKAATEKAAAAEKAASEKSAAAKAAAEKAAAEKAAAEKAAAAKAAAEKAAAEKAAAEKSAAAKAAAERAAAEKAATEKAAAERAAAEKVAAEKSVAAKAAAERAAAEKAATEKAATEKAATEKAAAERAAAEKAAAEKSVAAKAAAERAAAEKATAEKAATEKAAAERAVAEKAAAAKAAAERAAAEKAAAEKASAEKAAAEKAAAVERQRQQGQLDGARKTTLGRREEAVKAGADRLVKDVFDSAQKKLDEAETLARRQNFPGAAVAYQESADLYARAKARGDVVSKAKEQADSAKRQMELEKQRANLAAPEYAQARVEEAQANSLYESSSYEAAAQRYGRTADLYTKAKAAPKRSLAPSF